MARTGFVWTDDGTVGAASLSPLNGWPWPFPRYGISDGGPELRPVIMSMEDFFQLTWRVQTMHADFNITNYSIDPDTGERTNLVVIEQGFDFGLTPSGFPATENSLAREQDGYWMTYRTGSLSEAPCAALEVICSQSYFLPSYSGATSVALRLKLGGYLPESASLTSEGGDEAMEIVATFLGQPVTIFSFTGDHWDGTIDVSIVDYWPYADASGAAIYDSATGAQLITSLPRDYSP